MSGPEEALAAANTIQAPNPIVPIETKYEATVSSGKERREPLIRSLRLAESASGLLFKCGKPAVDCPGQIAMATAIHVSKVNPIFSAT
jgi:hypothetical protein